MDNADCGYYGLRGSHVIFKTLCDLYPNTSGMIESVKPLTRTDFLQFVMVPEACQCLIAEDMDMDLTHQEQEIKQIVKESSEFGRLVHDQVDNETMQGGHVF
jgi:hypothetical protein